MKEDRLLSETALDDYIKNNRKTEKRGRPTARKGKVLRATRRPVQRTRDLKPKAKPQNKLEIKNCHVDLTNKEIYDLFAKFGTLTKCKLLTDDIGRSKGIAIVEFENSENSQKAIAEYNQKEIKGSKLEVNFAEKRIKVETDRKKKIGKEKVRTREDRPLRRRFNSRDDRDYKDNRDERRGDRRGDRRNRKYSDERRDSRRHKDRDDRRGGRGRRNNTDFNRKKSFRRY